MAKSRALAILALGLALLVPPRSLHGQSALRLGSELQVNSFTLGYQAYPAVALDSDGDFVVAWTSKDGDGNGIFARRFDSLGTPQAAELQVNSFTPSDQLSPSVALDADGDFVVVWSSLGQDSNGAGIFARRFDSAGTQQATEFQVNSFTNDMQIRPAVAMDAAGRFVVAWDSRRQDDSVYGVFARRFNVMGIPEATEFQVNAYTSADQSFPAVAMDPGGDFVVAWQSYGQDQGGYGVFARRFDSLGTPQAVEFQVNTYTVTLQGFAAVDLDDAGGFVVAWTSLDQDGSFASAFARRFDAAGTPVATEFRANAYVTGAQGYPKVASAANGAFVVVWASAGQDGSGYGVFAQRFDSAGTPTGELQINTYTTGSQIFPVVSSDTHGDFVVAWQSLGQDGGDYGVFAQRFAPLAILDIDGNGAVGPLTDGLLVLRFLFGFTGTTLTSGAVDLAGCTRCNAAAIEPYLAALV